MSFMKKFGLGIGGIVAYLGRGIIAAHYNRGVQYATDAHIRYVGGGFSAILGFLLLNFLLVQGKMYGMQTMLAIVLPFVALYFLAAPRILFPVAGAFAANRAAERGDQENVWVARDAFLDLGKMAGIVLWWTEAYIFVTMVAPFHLYPALFWILHIPIVGALTLLMTGKVSVSKEVYEWSFKITITLLVVGVLAVFSFRESLGPWWAEHSASRGSQIEAQQDVDSIRTADQAYADWLERYVRINSYGEQVVIVDREGNLVPKDAATDTTSMHVEDAAPHIARAKARKTQTIRSVRDRGRSSAEGGGWWSNFKSLRTSEKGSDQVLFWVIVGLLHLPLIWLYKWAKNKGKEEAGGTDSKSDKKDDTKSVWGPYWGWFQVGIIIVIILAGINWVWHPAWLQPLIAKSNEIEAMIGVPKDPPKPAQNFLRSEDAGGMFAYVVSPKEHPYAGKPLALEIGVGVLERFHNQWNVRDIPWNEPVLRIKAEDGEYRLQQTVCAPPKIYSDGRSYATCTGSWNKGQNASGTYEMFFNSTQRMLVLTGGFGTIGMEIK